MRSAGEPRLALQRERGTDIYPPEVWACGFGGYHFLGLASRGTQKETTHFRHSLFYCVSFLDGLKHSWIRSLKADGSCCESDGRRGSVYLNIDGIGFQFVSVPVPSIFQGTQRVDSHNMSCLKILVCSHSSWFLEQASAAAIAAECSAELATASLQGDMFFFFAQM